ncbi:MAG: hypothetical protein R3Y38_07770 [Rikenellaceae bacterium]
MKLKLILFLCLSSLFIGCNDMSDEYMGLLEGKWKTTSGKEITSINGLYTESFYIEFEFFANKTVDFKMRNALCACDGECDGSCNTNGTVYSYAYDETGSYSVDDDELYISTDNLMQTGTITKLNNTTLIYTLENVYDSTSSMYFTKKD